MPIIEVSAIPEFNAEEILEHAGDVVGELAANAKDHARKKRRALDEDIEKYRTLDGHQMSASLLWQSRMADETARIVETAERIVQDTNRPLPAVYAGLLSLCAARLEAASLVDPPATVKACEREAAIVAVARILAQVVSLFVPGADELVGDGDGGDVAPF